MENTRQRIYYDYVLNAGEKFLEQCPTPTHFMPFEWEEKPKKESQEYTEEYLKEIQKKYSQLNKSD